MKSATIGVENASTNTLTQTIAVQTNLDLIQLKNISNARNFQKAVNDFVQLEAEVKKMTSTNDSISLDQLSVINKNEYAIYKALGFETLKALNFSKNLIRAELIKRHNEDAEKELQALLLNEFEINRRYSSEEVKHRLQHLYAQVGLRCKRGFIKTANATELGMKNRLKVQDCPIVTNGKRGRGYLILDINY